MLEKYITVQECAYFVLVAYTSTYCNGISYLKTKYAKNVYRNQCTTHILIYY